MTKNTNGACTNKPGYKEAIEWLAYNDDNTWVEELDPNTTDFDDPKGEATGLTVTAACIRDLWGVTQTKLVADLRRCLAKDTR